LNQPTVDYSRKWYVMAAVAMGIFLATIDGSIVNIALPTLVRAFGTDFATVEWVVLAYLATMATLLLGVGRLADMKGKKRIYTVGFIVFTAGSVLCGLSPTIHWLIGARVLQGIGAAMIMALGMAIVTEAFPPNERGKALGITGAMVSIGIVTGPTLGGLLLSVLSWHWIFFVNLPVGILGILMVVRFVPAIRPSGGQRFDFAGALALLAGLLSLLLALSLSQHSGFTSPAVLALLAAWAGALILFVWIERRAVQPMIDLRLFQNKLFSVSLVTGLITFIAMAGTAVLMPFYLQGVQGLNPRQAGLLLTVVPISLGLSSPISGMLSDRLGVRPITMAGLAVLLGGFLAVSTLRVNTTPLGYVLRFIPLGLGMGIFQSPNNSAIMGAAPRGRLGIVSGMLALNRALGQTIGIALLGAAWAGRTFYHAGQIPPEGAPGAPAAAQVAGLNDIYLGLAVLLAVALGLAIWAFARERQTSSRRAAQADTTRQEFVGTPDPEASDAS
jgi:EmrB/QacA subfamily drug resistance transporter